MENQLNINLDNQEPANKIFLSGHSNSFDTGIARALGVNAAIVFNHIIYWLRFNVAKKQNQHDDKTWMFESYKEIAESLGYFTAEQVKYAIEKLVKAKYLIIGNYHNDPFKRTNWYTVFDQNLLFNSKLLYEKGNVPKQEIEPSGHKGNIPTDGGSFPNVIYKEKTNTENKHKEETNKLTNDNDSSENIDSLFSDFDSSLSNSDFDSLFAFIEHRNIAIKEKTLKTWFKKYSYEKIMRNLSLLLELKKSPRNAEAWMETALYEDYAKKIENIEKNKKFIENFIREKGWKNIKINQQYCVYLPTKDDYQYSINPINFAATIQLRYEKDKESGIA